MPAMINVFGQLATCERALWKCENKSIEGLLNARARLHITTHTDRILNLNNELALVAEKEFDAIVISLEPAAEEMPGYLY